MKKSAMGLAFQALRRKPMVLLLLLPMPVISVLVSAISLQTIPDLSKMLDMNYMMNYASGMDDTQALMMTNAISMLVSALSMLLSAVSVFLLIPPVMELLADGVAGADTAPGWYLRGLRSHWWKPVVDSIISGGIFGVLFIPLYIIFIIVVTVLISAVAMGSAGGMGYVADPADMLNGALTGMMPAMIIVIVVFVTLIYGLKWIVYSVFGLFLPALADRSFGGAFKLLFSKKGFRKLPRMLGGQLLIELVPGVFYGALCAAYLVIMGIPQGPLGFVIALLDFVKSWAGILGMLVTSVFGVLIYPFRFGVHQLVKDEEAAEQPLQYHQP